MGPLLHVYRLPEGRGAEFEASLAATPKEIPARLAIKDSAERLKLLLKCEADGVYEGGGWISLAAPEIVERCRALANGNSGAVAVTVQRP
jgi:hypothetical protein